MTTDLVNVRARLRKMSHHQVFALLDDAVGMLPKARLEALVRRYISAEAMQADKHKGTSGTRH